MSRPYRSVLARARATTGLWRRWRLARVHGRSMLPTLRPGDMLLLDATAPVVVGAVVVAVLPDGTPAVKRVAWRDGQQWWLERDNPREGVDSWQVGGVADDDVVGVARARLWPRPGRLPSPAP